MLFRSNLLKSLCKNNLIILNSKEKKINLTVKNKLENGTTMLNAKIFGQDIIININFKHLNDLIRTIESQKIEIIIPEKKTFILIKEENLNSIYITLPIKI